MAADRGYDICVNYLERGDRADEVVEKAKAKGRKAIAVQADVAKEADVARMFESVDKELGGLDALVNSAGVTGGISRLDDERINEELLANLWAINITGTVIPCRYAVRRMSTNHGGKGGSIVNVWLRCLKARRGRQIHPLRRQQRRGRQFHNRIGRRSRGRGNPCELRFGPGLRIPKFNRLAWWKRWAPNSRSNASRKRMKSHP